MKVIAKSVEMVVVHNKDGSMRPIRFRLTAEDESEQVIKVDTIRTRDKEKVEKQTYSIYTCIIHINNIQQLCEIRYQHETCKWFLWKI